ncbi:tRNA dihydrouridine synthase DusB [Candidatus Woesearchaeota archaeon]|nr:tRNA dihydrouridine synthase DusB [Candidatus Woesearchaeota archaeon]
MKIGKIKLENKFILAPLDAVNCGAFRLLCRENGASLVYSQMLHCDGVAQGNEDFIERYIDIIEKERPVAFQLIGNNAENMKRAAEILDEFSDIIDVNLGCSMKKVLGLKCGAFFIKHPEQISRVLKPVFDATNKPVTVKIRIGWDSNHLNHVKVSKMLEDFGVSAIAVHARVVKQGYRGKANWSAIKQVKEKVNVPVIGNGDIFAPEDAKRMLEMTNCDAVMIARGAIGNPYIFKQCVDYFGSGKYKRLDRKKIYEGFMKFYNYYKKYQKRDRFPEIKQHACWFFKKVEGAKLLREEVLKVENEDELLKVYQSLLK